MDLFWLDINPDLPPNELGAKKELQKDYSFGFIVSLLAGFAMVQ